MKYQPANLNFIPKDEKDIKNDKANPISEEKPLTTPPSNPLPEEVLKKESPTPMRDVFNLEEKIMLNNQIEHLREQLSYSENQVSTLQIKLRDSNNQIGSLEEQLKNYETFKNDLDNVSTLNTSLTKLSKENATLKQELKQQKDHIQMLYLVLGILAIL